jgi:hypothetical protein
MKATGSTLETFNSHIKNIETGFFFLGKEETSGFIKKKGSCY